MKRFALLLVVLCSLAAVWGVAPSRGSSGEEDQPEGDFAAEVLMIYCEDSSMNTVLGEVRVSDVGGRSFLVGKRLTQDGKETAWSKATQWMPVDDVVSMVEFDNVEDARRATSEAKDSKL